MLNLNIKSLIDINPNDALQFILRTLGAYGLIIIFAQDSGIETNPIHKKVILIQPFQFLMFVSIAFAVTDDYLQAFMGAVIYYVIKLSTSSEL